jgi:hypothetical protein
VLPLVTPPRPAAAAGRWAPLVLMEPSDVVCSCAMICKSFWFSFLRSSTCKTMDINTPGHTAVELQRLTDQAAGVVQLLWQHPIILQENSYCMRLHGVSARPCIGKKS